MHKVKIINDHKELIPTHIYIDDTEINGVKSLEYFGAAVDEVPVFKFEVAGMPEVIEIGQANIQFQFTPQTVKEASNVIRHNLLADEFLYSSLAASIYSALKEIPAGAGLCDIAKLIADRIIGRNDSEHT